MATCCTCKYAKERPGLADYQCHRYPPVRVDDIFSKHPVVSRYDWCGEYIKEPEKEL